jgi:hypothetical protein
MGVPHFPQLRIRMTALFLGSGWSMGNPEVIPRTACKVRRAQPVDATLA